MIRTVNSRLKAAIFFFFSMPLQCCFIVEFFWSYSVLSCIPLPSIKIKCIYPTHDLILWNRNGCEYQYCYTYQTASGQWCVNQKHCGNPYIHLQAECRVKYSQQFLIVIIKQKFMRSIPICFYNSSLCQCDFTCMLFLLSLGCELCWVFIIFFCIPNFWTWKIQVTAFAQITPMMWD